jgi:sirohydrochlorin ferrochelatase
MKECIVLLGHGSPKKEANNLDQVAAMLHTMRHAGCTEDCVKVAYHQYVKPGIQDIIEECVKQGARKVIIHPFFVSAGVHVTRDIPGMIEKARKLYPQVEFLYTEPLGIHEKLAQIVMERIDAAEQRASGDKEMMKGHHD